MKFETPGISLSKKNILVIGSITLSAYFVITLWNFWSTFIDALGFNATVFILATAILFLTSQGITLWKHQFAWIIPIALISLSFSLWENPYLKVINVLLLPFILSVVFNYALNQKKIIDAKFIVLSVAGRIALLLKLKESVRLIFGRLSTTGEEKKGMFSKIILGLSLFAILALVVFIPLLSSADPEFATLMKGILDWFHSILSFRYMGRIVFAVLASIFLISYFLSFNEEGVTDADKQTLPKNQPLDPVISGIVLGGVLTLYLIFIGMQFSRLWISQLPLNFHTTEQLVKSGFWQLFILSVINIIFFFGYFKRTNTTVQSILKVFTIASFLLLVSAAHRMFLYVFFYGLSYEKFFASYTVIYCAILFIWLIYQLFTDRESNLFKYLMFSLLWMYAIATVLPIERIIFSFNANASHRSDSRIKMNELQMLSYDALPLVATYRKDEKWQREWCYWAERKIRTVEKKKWYEKNLANFANIQTPEIWKTGECDLVEERPMQFEPVPTPPKDIRKIHKEKDFSFQVKYPNEGWRLIKIFDYEKNKGKGVHIYKDEGSDVTIQPLGMRKLAIDNRTKPTISKCGGTLDGGKTVWENPDGSGMISIKLSSYPKSWSNDHAIEARYTKDTKKEVEAILESITLATSEKN